MMMRSLARKCFHIGPTLGLVSMLFLVVFWVGLVRAQTCPSEFPDIASKAYMAPVVLEATVQGPVHSMESSSKTNYLRHYVNLRVDKVYKGPLKDKTRITLHFFGSPTSHTSYSSSRNNNYNINNNECTLQTNFFQRGKKYIVFADIVRDNAAPDSGNNFTLISVPVLQNKTSSRQVRKILCTKCAIPPSVKGLKKTMKVNTSGQIKLMCRFEGRPPPTIQWFKDGKHLKPMNNLNIVTNRKHSRLTIRKAKPIDGGEYECRASNVVGSPASMKTRVIVKPATLTTTSTVPPFDSSADRQPCVESFYNYCHNGGTCYHIKSLNEMICECKRGYMGSRCVEKVADKPPENRKEFICDTNILTFVVVILGVILFVTLVSNLTYFILRKKRKMQKKEKKVSNRTLSREATDNLNPNGDSMEMKLRNQDKHNKSRRLINGAHHISSDNVQDEIDGANFTQESVLVNIPVNISQTAPLPSSPLLTPPQPKLDQRPNVKSSCNHMVSPVHPKQNSQVNSINSASPLLTESQSKSVKVVESCAPTSSKLVEGNNNNSDSNEEMLFQIETSF